MHDKRGFADILFEEAGRLGTIADKWFQALWNFAVFFSQAIGMN